MNISALCLLLVPALVAAAGCTRENLPNRVENRSPYARAAESPEQATTSTQASQTAQAVPEVDGSHLRETAEEYIARRGADAKPFESGEIAPGAVGPVVACITCHGAHGEGIPGLATPRIGGMPAWYLARELKYFHQGVRAPSADDVHGTQMRAVLLASRTDAAGLEGLAGYFATFDPPPAPALESGNAAHGEQLFATCVACHGADGKGSPSLNTPSLVEQDGEYLVRQIENFRSGIRGTDMRDIFGQQMRAIAASLITSRQDAVDVVAYIGSLRGD
jgi:cytochrome c553